MDDFEQIDEYTDRIMSLFVENGVSRNIAFSACLETMIEICLQEGLPFEDFKDVVLVQINDLREQWPLG